jgi:hypothetical protein
MSAPWLIVPFLVGMTQDRPRRAAGLGLLVTMTALLGYFWMSKSAFEGVPLDRTLPRMEAMIRTDTNLLWIAGGLITGPLFGYLGHRWRVARSWVAAALVVSALCLEPVARASIGTWVVGGLSGSRVVWSSEIAVGVAAAVVFGWMIVATRRAREVPRS